MRITITGPRSVGKSTISKIVAKKLKLKYISSDEIGERALKKQGGLDKAIKSGTIGRFIKSSAYGLIREVYKNKDKFVFDLSGGSITSKKFKEASQKVRKTARKNSIIIGLLPSKNTKYSINLLFKREIKRKHFKKLDPEELYKKVKEDYKKFHLTLKKLAKFIIYTDKKTPERIADKIISSLEGITPYNSLSTTSGL